jgi:hypothetical protein
VTHSPADPEAIRQLHALLAEDELDERETTDTDAGISADSELVLDPQLQEAIGLVGLDAMSPDARELLLKLTDYSENLEPTTRENLVSAADRGLQWRRDNAAALPVLLFARRREDKISPEQVSAQLGLPAKVLTDIESGASSVRSLPAGSVAAWIHLLRVDIPDAEAALKRGVERTQPSPRAAGVPAPRHRAEPDDHFIREVLDELRKLQAT